MQVTWISIRLVPEGFMMCLTLGNSLTGLVLNETYAAQDKAMISSRSLVTGRDHRVETVDAFIGNSLSDKSILLKSLAQNTAYALNLLAVTDEYLKSIASLLQGSLAIIATANSLSFNKRAILCQSLEGKKDQIKLLIDTAKFDDKKLLSGDVSNIFIQTSTSLASDAKISITDLSKGKLFRTSAVKTINRWLAEDYTRCNYYNSQSEIQQDLAKNMSLVDAAIKKNGSGTGLLPFTIQQLAMAIFSLRGQDSSFLSLLNETLPETISSLKAIPPHDNNRNLANATINQLAVALSKRAGFNGIKKEVLNLELDNISINFLSNNRPSEIALAKDIYTTALATIRAEQTNITNQKQNLLAITYALRATTDITQKASDSYLKTDYVATTQKYVQHIRTIIASITALQANNRIPETIQRLLDNIAK